MATFLILVKLLSQANVSCVVFQTVFNVIVYCSALNATLQTGTY